MRFHQVGRDVEAGLLSADTVDDDEVRGNLAKPHHHQVKHADLGVTEERLHIQLQHAEHDEEGEESDEGDDDEEHPEQNSARSDGARSAGDLGE